MRAVLALEFIGENYWSYQRVAKKAIREGRFFGVVDRSMERAYFREAPAHRSKPWVARLTGLDTHYGIARTFVDGQIDYSGANSSGSRGVMLYFALTPGLYEVYEHLSWTKDRRYYIRVTDDAALSEVPLEEVETWLLSLRP